MNLLALLAIPSFVAFCLLAVIHTFQTLSLRMAENAPLPAEALLQEFLPASFPALPVRRTAKSVAARERSYEYLLKNCTSLSGRAAFFRQSDHSTIRRPLAEAPFLRNYRQSWLDSSFRAMAPPDARYKTFAARDIYPRRRTRLSAITRRSRTLNTALLSYA